MTMRRWLGAMLVAGLTSAVACNPQVTVNEDGDGGSGAGGDGSGGSGNTCAAYLDEAGQPVTLRIVNDSPSDVYLPTLCDEVAVSIAPAEGDDGVAYTYDESCLTSCEKLQSGEPLACPAEACAQAVRHVAPGETFEMTWDGTGLMDTDMPEICWHDETYGPSCSQIISAPAQRYDVQLPAYDSCDGECNCDANGICFGQASGLEGFHDPATIDHPNDEMVEVVFGPCAFSCTGG